MKLSSKIYSGFAFVLLLFVILTLINLRLARKTQERNTRLNLTEQVLTKSANMQRYVLDMEDALRGYLLTGNDEFISTYKTAVSDFEDLDSGMIFLLKDNKEQKNILVSVSEKLKTWRDSFASPLIADKMSVLIKRTKEDNARYNRFLGATVGAGVGKNITDNIRGSFNEFDHTEKQEKKTLEKELQNSIRNEEIVLLFIAGLCLVGGVIIAFYITLTISYRIKAIKENIDTIAAGKFNSSIIDTQKDELSGLAEAVNIMSENLKEKILTLEAENKILQRELKSMNRGNTGN